MIEWTPELEQTLQDLLDKHVSAVYADEDYVGTADPAGTEQTLLGFVKDHIQRQATEIQRLQYEMTEQHISDLKQIVILQGKENRVLKERMQEASQALDMLRVGLTITPDQQKPMGMAFSQLDPIPDKAIEALKEKLEHRAYRITELGEEISKQGHLIQAIVREWRKIRDEGKTRFRPDIPRFLAFVDRLGDLLIEYM